jgi:ribosomal protein L37E
MIGMKTIINEVLCDRCGYEEMTILDWYGVNEVGCNKCGYIQEVKA